VLDVGCGDKPQGDVNVDLCIGKTADGRFVNPKQTPNFIRCHARFLPFRDSSFQKVICDNMIEHDKYPFTVLKELVRVSEMEILVKTPHRFSRNAKKSYHKSYFTRTWFIEAAKKLNCRLETKMTKTPLILLVFLTVPLLRNDEITARLVKIGNNK